MLILLREDGKRASWHWSTETGDYVKREGEKLTRMSAQEYLVDVLEDGRESTRCDGMQKWIEKGRPR
jgi:hypothetical protein